MNKDEMLEDIKSAIGVASFYKAPYQAQEMTDYLWRKGYRIVGDDEIVVKKSEYEKLSKDYSTINNEAYYCGFSVGVEETKQETAREILLQVEHDYVEHPVLSIFEIVERIADKYGIELERNL